MYASACSRNLTLGAPCCQRMPRVHRTFALRAETSDGGELRDMAADMLGKDPEVKERLERVAAAAERVAELQKKSADIEREIRETRERGKQAEAEILAEAREREDGALKRLADVQMKQAEQKVLEAELAMQEAQLAKESIEEVARKDAERVASVKAAFVSAAGGTLGSLPYIIGSDGTGAAAVVDVLSVGAACFLFGVVWRYAVRTDVDDSNLKSGVVAAFGIVRGSGLAQGEITQALGGDLTSLATAGLLVGEALLGFFFAAAALELAVKKDVVKLYGTSGSLVDEQ